MGLFSALSGADKTRFKKLKEEGCVVTFLLEVPAAEVENETHTLLLRIQQQARLPGFRPGKAPLEVVKKHFEGHAREQVVDSLLRKFIPQALRELSLNPVAAPLVERASLESGKPARFEVRVEIAPKVEPQGYTKIKVQKKSYPATEEAVEARLKELREAHARLERSSAEAAAKTHYAVIDYEVTQDGKPKGKGAGELVDLSSEQILEGLAEGLVGMRRGETKEIAVKLGGKPASLTATLVELKEKALPVLDDEFAKDMGFATLSELKAKLKEVIDEEGKAKSEREVSQQLEAALLKANRIPLPPSLVEAQLEHMIERARQQFLGPKGKFTEKQEAELREKLRARAEDELRIAYLLPAIAEREKLQALAEDVSAELEKNLAAADSEAKKEEIRKLFAERKDSIASMIRERKAMRFIRDKAVVTEG